jgi:hypothetical protein
MSSNEARAYRCAMQLRALTNVSIDTGRRDQLARIESISMRFLLTDLK